jgi:hypothetical protein
MDRLSCLLLAAGCVPVAVLNLCRGRVLAAVSFVQLGVVLAGQSIKREKDETRSPQVR